MIFVSCHDRCRRCVKEGTPYSLRCVKVGTPYSVRGVWRLEHHTVWEVHEGGNTIQCERCVKVGTPYSVRGAWRREHHTVVPVLEINDHALWIILLWMTIQITFLQNGWNLGMYLPLHHKLKGSRASGVQRIHSLLKASSDPSIALASNQSHTHCNGGTMCQPTYHLSNKCIKTSN